MKQVNFDRKKQRKLRHLRTTKTLKRCENTLPRLVVSKTDHHIYAQIIDDSQNKVLAATSTLTLKLKANNLQAAKQVGTEIAKLGMKVGVSSVAFDRGGNKYHGRVAALANAAREAGLKF